MIALRATPVGAPVLVVVAALVGVAAGAGAALLALRVVGRSRLDSARDTEAQLLADARRDAEATRREAQIAAREQAVVVRAELEAELRERRDEVVQIEERVLAKEEDIDRKLTELSRREQGIADREIHLKELQEELKQTRQDQRRALERAGGLTVADAKKQILAEAEEQVRHELAGRVRQMEEQAATEAKRRARNLVADARIHPSRIEEMYYRSKEELDEHIRQAGEQAVFEANCGEIHEELV